MREAVLGLVTAGCAVAAAVWGFGRPAKRPFRWPMFSESSRIVLILHDADGRWVNPYRELLPGDHGLNLPKLRILLAMFADQDRNVSGLALLRDGEGEEVFRIVDNAIEPL